MSKQKIRRSVMCYGYDTNVGYRETWGRPATKKELKEWCGKLVSQDLRVYEMDLDKFIVSAEEVAYVNEGYSDEN